MVKIRNNKKAMEMGINVIVMLIIGMTVMGLVIGMVTDLIGGASSGLDDKLQEAEQREKDVVLKKSGFFAVGPEVMKVPLKGTKKFFIKINNRGSDDLNLNDNWDSNGAISPTSGFLADLSYSVQDIVGACSNGLTLTTSGAIIKPQDTQVITVAVQADKADCMDGDELFINLNFAGTGDEFDETAVISVTIEG